MKRSVFLLALVLGILLLASGCVSTNKFETAISDVTTRIDGVQSTVEEHGDRLAELESKDSELATTIASADAKAQAAQQTGETAIVKADEAAKAARGKVLWQVTLTSSDARFGVDKVEVSEQSRAALDDLAAKVKAMDRAVYLEIQGHTDSSGAEAYNEKLAFERAEAVRTYLYGQGIPLHMMEVVSFGETRPVADNGTAEGRAQNRRVEVIVLE